MTLSNSWFIAFTKADISKFKIAKEDMPGDRFQPRKGQEVYMLRKTQAQEDLIAPKSRPNRKVTTPCQYPCIYCQAPISAILSETEHSKTKNSTHTKVKYMT